VDQAVTELEKAVQLDPQCAAAWVNLGGARLTRMDFAGCVEANRRAAVCDPDLTLAAYNEGLAHLYLGQAREMTDCFERVLELEPNHAAGHYYLAVGLLELGRTDEAVVSLQRATALGHSPQPDFLRAVERALAEAQDAPDVAREDMVKPK
jgi:cytochrome c-type biogenesis protein CcmH/NrfG